MKKFYLKGIIWGFAFTIINSSHTIDQQAVQKLTQIGGSAYSTFPTLCKSYELTIECINNNISGDIVECGVAAGAQIGAMAYACKRLNSNKIIRLFDSFEGVPLAGPNDDQQPGIGAISHSTNVTNLNSLLVSSGIGVFSIEQVKANLASWKVDSKNQIYHKGWFQYTLPIEAPQIPNICLLRLDGDLYESTKVCLEYLYPKITKGGYIIIDDYALAGCKKAVDEYLAKYNLRPTIIKIEGGMGPIYWKID